MTFLGWLLCRIGWHDHRSDYFGDYYGQWHYNCYRCGRSFW